MIQRAFITQWGTVVPWSSPRLVEQDLIICRALVSIYTDEFLSDTTGLLRPGLDFDPKAAWQKVHDDLIVRLRKEKDLKP